MKKIILTILVVLFLSADARADITTGLVGWWKYDEGSGSTATDSSGNGNNGTEVNGPTYITGKVGPYALSFVKASSQYVDVTSNIPTSYPITIAAWINIDATSQSGVPIIAGLSGPIGTSGATARKIILLSSGVIYLFAENDDDSQFISINGSFSPSTNTWVHVVGVFSSSSSFTLYINGVSNATSSGPVNFGTKATHFYTAIDSDTTGNTYFEGGIDDVRLYNRALTSSDVSQLYAFTGSTYRNLINQAKLNQAKFQ